MAVEWGWEEVPARGRLKFPAGAEGGVEVIGRLISLSRCGPRGREGEA